MKRESFLKRWGRKLTDRHWWWFRRHRMKWRILYRWRWCAALVRRDNTRCGRRISGSPRYMLPSSPCSFRRYHWSWRHSWHDEPIKYLPPLDEAYGQRQGSRT